MKRKEHASEREKNIMGRKNRLPRINMTYMQSRVCGELAQHAPDKFPLGVLSRSLACPYP